MCDGSFLPEPAQPRRRQPLFFSDLTKGEQERLINGAVATTTPRRTEYACTCLPEGLGEPLCSGCRKNARIASKGYKVCSCAPGRVCPWHASK